MTEPTPIVRWPGGPSGPDPWDDGFWPSLDPEGRHQDLWDAWDAVRTGAISEERFEEAARAAGVTGPLAEDRNRPKVGTPASLGELARIAADHWPAVGMDGPDLVLGRASLFADASLRLVVMAGCAFVTTTDVPFSPAHIWARRKPEPRHAERLRVQQVAHAPWAIWAVERRRDGVHLHDHTGIGPMYRPDGPVTILGGDPGTPALAARLVHTPSGWLAHTPVPLRVLPDAREVARALLHETWLARTAQPGITSEALLRRRPVLVRHALEACGGVL